MSNGTKSNGRPGPEVNEKPVRRQFKAEYKIRIIGEADGCTAKGYPLNASTSWVALLRMMEL